MRAKGQKAHGKKKVKYKTGVKEGTKHCYHGNTEVEMRISGPLPLTPQIPSHSLPT